ncbi:hypothetical protein SAMN02745898_104312 [Streptomyces sp. 136MFCol5.1]|uniref:hypothetical protein n=1 Tax=Streptomyces sp. 136MFCol5.1 TaxID=1172182 RepID=UPI000880076B|nr:hypothetical protein [Streptomyces sp. 136MFCol5.1]SCY86572.1 hypothetical protein SAMN02745898_104312 [Streptomyces sp. 136MFCol5.1]
MINLEQSRKTFHAVRNLPVQNFWKTLFQAQGRVDVLNDPRYKEYFAWVPNRSNCPEIEVLMEGLTASIPEEWRARGRRIFAGRNLRTQANAEAWQSGEVGIIELNYGFTSASMIYMVLYCKYFEMISSLGPTMLSYEEGDDAEVILDVLQEIGNEGFEPILIANNERKTWQVEGVFPAHELLRELPASRDKDSYHEGVRSIEEFALAHEYAHHLLGHTNDEYPRSRYINGRLDRELAELGIDLSAYDMNTKQIDELRADSLALLIMSGKLTMTPTGPTVYRTMSGGIIGLTVLAHIYDAWVNSNDPKETHPDFLTRYDAATRLLKGISKTIPVGPHEDHPLDFLSHLSGFVSLIIDRWLGSEISDHKEINVLGLTSWLFERRAKVLEELEGLRNSS